MLLFVDGTVILQGTEDCLQKSMHEIRQLRSIRKFKMNTVKSYSFSRELHNSMKIILGSNSFIDIFLDSFGCNVKHNYDGNLDKKTRSSGKN
jgi:phage baseplate assembly protein W